LPLIESSGEYFEGSHPQDRGLTASRRRPSHGKQRCKTSFGLAGAAGSGTGMIQNSSTENTPSCERLAAIGLTALEATPSVTSLFA